MKDGDRCPEEGCPGHVEMIDGHFLSCDECGFDIPLTPNREEE